MNLLIRFVLAVAIGIIGYFLKDITFIKYLVVGGILAVTGWGIADFYNGTLDRVLTGVYGLLGFLYMIYSFATIVQKPFEIDKFGTSNSETLVPIGIFLIIFILLGRSYMKKALHS